MPSALPAPANLYLLRHAQPLIAAGVCYGQLDVPADPGHTSQAALRFATQKLGQCAVLRHSPLQRCTQLVHAMSDAPASVRSDTRLQEMHFGQWEGRAWNDIGKDAVDAWSQDLYSHAPGGGESLAAMLLRVKAALVESWHYDSQLGQRSVVWVTHAGVIRCVQWLLRYGNAQPASRDWNLPAPAFGQSLALPWHAHTAALQALD